MIILKYHQKSRGFRNIYLTLRKKVDLESVEKLTETFWQLHSVIKHRRNYDQLIKFILPGIQNSIRYLWKIFRKPT